MPASPAEQTAELVRHYRWLRQYGLNDSHSGNASLRDGDRMWVTPSGCCADLLAADDLLAAPIDAPLHAAVYRACPQARAVLHCHPPHLLALTFDGDDFVPRDFEGELYFPRIPVVSIPFNRYVADAPAMVAELLAEYTVAVVRGHGLYARGDSINLAYKWCCSVELSAHIELLTRAQSK